MSDYLVKCCRCRNKHIESSRVKKPSKKIKGLSDLVCPKCECTTYYRLEEISKEPSNAK